MDLFAYFLSGCGLYYRIQELYFLFRMTIQSFDILVDHICVDTGNSLCQFTFAFFGFWIMDNHIDWSTLSGDTTHLPGISVYEREVVRYYSDIRHVSLLQIIGISAIMLLVQRFQNNPTL